MNVFSWGSNSRGQLGLSFCCEQVLEPTKVNTTVHSVKQISGGGNHSLLLNCEGKIYETGYSDDNHAVDIELSRTHINFVFLEIPIQKVSKVGCGWNFSACILEDGRVLGWGSNTFQQLSRHNSLKVINEPRFLDVPPCIDLACGLRHLLLVTQNGSVIASGANRKCQLSGAPENNKPFNLIASLNNIHTVACGENFSLALSSSQVLYGWGDNKFGQICQNIHKTNIVSQPSIIHIRLGQKEGIKEIFCGWGNSAVLSDGGILYTWGRNDYGQLGDTKRISTWLPAPVNCQLKFKQVSVGAQHTVALTQCKQIRCWGWNEHGSCGDGTQVNKYDPISVNLPDELSLEGVGSGSAHSFVWATTKGWPCFKTWVTSDGKPDLEYLDRYAALVQVAQCDSKVYDVQEKIEMSLTEYLRYWKKYNSGLDDRCLYLKDWHFMKNFPKHAIYRVPKFFASDWLGEYFDNHPEMCDDYRFVYMGPKGSWTPLHQDVFSSYSWSVNVVGQKRWLLIEPGNEGIFKDQLGNLLFEKNLTIPSGLEGILDLEQEAGDAIFVPSGWHHQVWNLEDTISINQNWINGSNIHWMWKSLQKNLIKVQKEIDDCQGMDDWEGHCQLMLKSLYGIDFCEFHKFLEEIITIRLDSFKAKKKLKVFGEWELGLNYLRYDLKSALLVLEEFKESSYIKEKRFEAIEYLYNQLRHSLHT